MHNAPSVSYPVGRCVFQRWLYVGFTVSTSAVLWTWALHQGLTPAWYASTAFAAAGGFLGWETLRMRAMLTWDGQVWCLHDQNSGGEDVLGVVHVTLDVQTALLLRWQPASDTLNAKPQWLWLGARTAGNDWQNLRCAVYQRIDL